MYREITACSAVKVCMGMLWEGVGDEGYILHVVHTCDVRCFGHYF